MTSTVVITARNGITSKTVAETPPGLPNIIVKPLTIAERIAIKAIKVYLSSLIGFLGVSTVGTLPGTVKADDFTSALINAATLSIAPTVVNIIFNLYILFMKLDEDTPELMA